MFVLWIGFSIYNASKKAAAKKAAPKKAASKKKATTKKTTAKKPVAKKAVRKTTDNQIQISVAVIVDRVLLSANRFHLINFTFSNTII